MGKQAKEEVGSSKTKGLKKIRDQAKTISKVTKAIKKDKDIMTLGQPMSSHQLMTNKDNKMSMKEKKKSRPSAKKRRFLQLLKSQPKRDENPLDLRDHQIQQVKKVLSKAEKEQLSRGQKKRLKKKERFISSKVIE